MLLRRRTMMGAAKSLEGMLGSLKIGTIVTIGSVGDFILVHQGNPDTSIYDASCTGTWLFLADCYQTNYERMFDSSDNNYNGSSISEWLKNTFDNLFSDSITPKILSVKIPYFDDRLQAGNFLDNGFACKSFLPSMCEIGFDHSENVNVKNQNVPQDGNVLAYFKSISDGDLSHSDEKRKASNWYWSRTPWAGGMNTSDVYLTLSTGSGTSRNCSLNYGIRPMIIMDQYTPIDGDEIAIVE